MGMINDGGPIHPIPEMRDPMTGEGIMPGWNGMSLRDWFAGKALVGSMFLLGQDDEVHDVGPSTVAQHCYGIADAMLAERTKVAPSLPVRPEVE